ncbi:MAG: ribosomal protein S5, C-terminal domain-containing protein [Benjaminiella poitrasii]|nr:MAG: ribosomal protein S5, C-terminal domain-containing protein [Benjaminiella poitrasii]
MLALRNSLNRLTITSASRSATVAATWHPMRHYATVEDTKSRKRNEALNKDNVPQLDKIDSILDHPTEKTKTLDQPKLFTSHRPAEVVLNAVTDIIDSPLPVQEQAGLMKKALVIKRVVNMNGKGKQPSMYALVVVGNSNGLAGYGEGKDEEASRAVRKATNRAIKNMRYFDRYDRRTIAMDLTHKFHATTLELRSRPPGFGIRTNHYVHEICRCIGIQDISAKVRGSRTPMNVIKATFEALSHQKQPEDIAKMRGKKLEDVQHVYYGGQ